MRIERIIYSVLILAAAFVAVINWRRAAFFQADNEELRGRLETLELEASSTARVIEIARGHSEKLRDQSVELARIRNELTQARSGSNDTKSLATENQRLKTELADLRSASASAPDPAGSRTGGDQFPRDAWSFAGYGSPESALVSAIWAMKEGNPQTYLESLTPQEQERMAQVWQNKAENEIARKHKNDVSSIAGLRVLERQNLSPTEVVMNVYLEGPGRVEKIRMHQVGQDWKFGGFIREPQPQ
jgi:hypothetical protein